VEEIYQMSEGGAAVCAPRYDRKLASTHLLSNHLRDWIEHYATRDVTQFFLYGTDCVEEVLTPRIIAQQKGNNSVRVEVVDISSARDFAGWYHHQFLAMTGRNYRNFLLSFSLMIHFASLNFSHSPRLLGEGGSCRSSLGAPCGFGRNGSCAIRLVVVPDVHVSGFSKFRITNTLRKIFSARLCSNLERPSQVRP
jgi:hypothetical protein